MSGDRRSPANIVVVELLRMALAEGRQPWLTISSHSMHPLLRPGDAVQVGAVSAESLPPGAIIVIDTGVHLLTHRYLGTVHYRGAPYLVTRGDRPWALDAPWPPDAVVGRIIARRRDGRRVDLTRGGGARLDRAVQRLLTLELALLAPHAQRLAWEDVANPDARRLDRPGARPARGQRAIRAALYRMAWLADALTDRWWRLRPQLRLRLRPQEDA